MKIGLVSVLLAGALVGACQPEAEQKPEPIKKDTPQSPNQQTGDQTGTGSTNGTTFYTGFDGATNYSLLVPGFLTYTIDDPSIAKVEEVSVTLSAQSIAELTAEAKAKNPNFDDTRFQRMFTRTQKAYRITPLKAGRTTLKTSRPAGFGGGQRGAGGGPRGGGRPGGAGGLNPWGSSSNSVNLVVTNYTAAQLQAGKTRYTTDKGGTLKACKSCHESGAEGAPPHELGRVMQISDSEALTWITTGQLNGRVAKITHKWGGLDTDDQKKGIVAYLRSLQTHDAEALTKLIFEENLANFTGRPPGGDQEK